MEPENDDASLESRPACPDDLVRLCRLLNEQEARYIVIGGMAMIQQGLLRLTTDIDLLIDSGAENVDRIKRAMSALPDNAVADVGADDVREYCVVRVADEFVTDLMRSACGIEYAEAIQDVCVREIAGVPIPFAGRRTLWKTKRARREKDVLDRNFLAARMRELGEEIPAHDGRTDGVDRC